MKTATVSAVLVIGVGVAFIAGAWHHEAATATAETPAGRRVHHYVDPMHPAYTSPKPGTAPDCGMQLEPVYEDAVSQSADRRMTGDAAAIQISLEQQSAMGVQVASVERISAGYRIRLFGRIAAEETRVYQVRVGVDGYLRDASSVTTGSRVEKDQWLATFSSFDARQPIQSMLVAVDVLDRSRKAGDNAVQMAVASASIQQGKDRLLTLGMSPLQIDEIEKTRLVPSTVRMTAPAAGFVVARSAVTGQQFERGAELFRIADLRKVWVHADAFGVDAEWVRAGLEAEVIVPGRPIPVRARLTDTLPQFDASSQAMKLRFEADNSAYLLRPDMFVDVDLRVPAPPGVAVPHDAVVRTGLDTFVYLAREAGRFEPHRVRTGRRSGELIEITHGLEPGDRVAVSGTFLLDSERRMHLDRSAAGVER
jgi:Cu(I)/Ag(I) efflux system membrane fusion protein